MEPKILPQYGVICLHSNVQCFVFSHDSLRGMDAKPLRALKAPNGPLGGCASGVAISRRLSVTKRHRTMMTGALIANAPSDSELQLARKLHESVTAGEPATKICSEINCRCAQTLVNSYVPRLSTSAFILHVKTPVEFTNLVPVRVNPPNSMSNHFVTGSVN